MKNIFLSTLLIVFYQSIFAQYYTTIKTPTNVTVEAIYFNEFTPDECARIETNAANWLNEHGSNAVRVAPASKTYNCHDYAWHYSDGGTKRWVNQLNKYGNANISKYWSGSSPTYQLTTSSNATKVFYSDGDHSAKVISPGVFESKWGAWPRYRHAPDDCPYTTSNKQYYAVPVTGSGLICSSGNYLTLNISGASYNWSGNKVSISGSGSSVSAIKTSNGAGWIKTQISSPYSGTTITTAKKTFWIGKPSFTLDVETPITTGGMGIASLDYPGGTISNVNWVCVGALSSITGSLVIARYRAGFQSGSGVVYATASNICGSKTLSAGVQVTGGWHKAYPNPAKDILTIEIDKSKISDKSIINNIEVRLYDKLMTLKKYGKTKGSIITIDVNDLKPDVYILQIKNGDEIFEEKIVVSEK